VQFLGKMGNKTNILIMIVSVIISIIFFTIIILNLIQNEYFEDTDFCDYDSCSQEIYKWNYNGSVCFDNNNVECQDFLRLWNICQDYKNKLGVC